MKDANNNEDFKDFFNSELERRSKARCDICDTELCMLGHQPGSCYQYSLLDVPMHLCIDCFRKSRSEQIAALKDIAAKCHRLEAETNLLCKLL